MSKIKMFSLGGLNENGKNMYVIEVDKDIFVFDAGLKYASEAMLGIDYVIPKIDYLIQNKDRLKGIFLTHGHDENIGAIGDIVKDLPDIKVYGSSFTIDMLQKELEDDNITFNNLIKIDAHKSINFDNEVKIFPVMLSHSIPLNFGYALYTKDGVIFYASDFVFDSTLRDNYQTDVGKLAYIGKQGVLCLLTESIYAGRQGYTSPNHRISSLIREVVNKQNRRILYNVLSSQLYRIQELFTEVEKTHRRVVIMGKRLQNIINYAISNNYLKINKDIIGDLADVNDNNVVIVISNEREKPYSNLQRIINGYDKYITLNKNDIVFMATPIYDGREKTFYGIADEVSKKGADMVMLDSKKNVSHHASSEDLMLMIDLMKPKYYFPVKGEYRFQVANADLASNVGIPNENILLKLNGDVICFENGKLVETKESIPNGDIYIDGSFNDGVEELVLRDRELLSDNGIVIISTTLSKRNKKIIAGPEVLTRGFVYVKDNAELITNISAITKKVLEDNITGNYVEYNKIKNLIRDEVSKFLYKETECKPMIITVFQEI